MTRSTLLVTIVLVAPFLPTVRAAEATEDLAAAVRALDPTVFSPEWTKTNDPRQMVSRDLRKRLREASARETAAWRQIKTRTDWEKYREPRIQALRASLGSYPPVPTLKVRTTAVREGDGFSIENLVLESRPGLAVTANLYVPARRGQKMPGLLIIPSHHNPKTQGELQDMGMTWSRLGCLVLIPDALGHGERRQHPFVDGTTYPKPFRVGRQDYYFRLNAGMQLDVIGDSLAGWMAWDYSRCIDLLLSREGIDQGKIVVLGAVAGGGDPAAVVAAIDRRVTAAVPFNFGGPQPETKFPLPADAELSVNFAGSGSWESTRNLRRSARDGFLPWVIVGSLAPRPLIYAHEFSWDQERDPVWRRLETIYGFYGAGDRVAGIHGKGAVTGKPPDATHCNNIGPPHRQGIYPLLKRWFDIAAPEQEYLKRRPGEELQCLTDKVKEEIPSKPVHLLAATIAAERVADARRKLGATEAGRKQGLRQAWAALLGDVEPMPARAISHDSGKIGAVAVERLSLEVGPELVIPVLIFQPPRKGDERLPVVLAFAQEGKAAFLKQRSEEIARLLRGGVAVCLPDLRGSGETGSGSDRGRSSSSTARSATEQMLGQTMLGARLRDLRSLKSYLKTRAGLDTTRIGLWGDSFSPVNDKDTPLAAPLDAEPLPRHSEPVGCLLALFGGLFDDDVRVVYGHGGIVGYQSLLVSPFCYFPHDVVVPGALTAGDLNDVATVLKPRPLRLEGLVDGVNRRVALAEVKSAYDEAQVTVAEQRGNDVAEWIVKNLAIR